jgi:hypothetical protein
MNSVIRSAAFATAMTGLMTGWSTTVMAGGVTLGDDEIQNLPSYFGFAKDTHGAFLGEVKVTVKLKNISVVAHTDVLGAYKILVISTEPDGVDLSCSKDGYRQTGTFRRTPPGVDARTPVEIECTLERQ